MTRLVIAGGGTGGHLFPGVAVAEALRERDPDASITFVGTKRGIEARVLPELGWPLEFIEVSGLKTVGVVGAIRGLLRVPRAMWQARSMLRQLRPDVVLGVGGYASGPVVLAAKLSGIPTAICEQNSIPGLTNKLLGKLVRRVFLAFDNSRQFFSPAKIEMSGNPVRAALVRQLSSGSAPARNSIGVLVCGGSQGATAVNEFASQALIALAARHTLTIVHQTGTRDLEPTTKRYIDANVAATCTAFINDMASAYHHADIVIGRAGATTVAELAIAGKPAVFIPYPFAANDHQELNAREMVDRGAALSFRQSELTADKLADALHRLLSDPDKRATMGTAMKSLAKPNAASAVVDWCVSQNTSNDGAPSYRNDPRP